MLRWILASAMILGPTFASAQEKPAFTPLWEKDPPGSKGTTDKDIPAVQLYRPAKANGALVVVCPGGGYGGLAMDHEGHQVAQFLNKHGITALVLRYRLAPYRHPTMLNDAQRAIRYARHHAKSWGCDPGKIGIKGFSAGGHLASTAGTHFDKGNASSEDPIDKLSSRPDFLILGYPVITLNGPFAHMGSRNNLLGKDADPKLVESLCNEKQVTAETPPTFLVHTTEDKGVPPENSVLFYMALTKHRVPAELHIYEKGRHGLGLGSPDSAFSSWPDRLIAWMNGRGLLGQP